MSDVKKRQKRCWGVWKKRAKSAESAEKSAFQPENDVLMSSDEECQRHLHQPPCWRVARAAR
jgi:hypothetical protein